MYNVQISYHSQSVSDLSKSLSIKKKCNGATEFSINDFLLVFNRKYGLIWFLFEIQAFKICDLDFALKSSLKVKSDETVGLQIYDSY